MLIRYQQFDSVNEQNDAIFEARATLLEEKVDAKITVNPDRSLTVLGDVMNALKFIQEIFIVQSIVA